ncbi:MAG TPA: class I SAM-dependent methyltransferase, partial [Polyangiaceae bacterium]|nr:class I SAM-dependent methyltransferase [Polyangiaceae bacterium]
MLEGSPFQPWVPERILLERAGLLFVDKPSGIPTHGGHADVAEDVVRRLALVLERRGEDPYLGVHQRLDQGTSGVLVFVRDAALNAAVKDCFETDRVLKRYVAAVELQDGSPLWRRERLTLSHRLELVDGRQREVARGGKPCLAECRVLRRVGCRALVALEPKTGRTHQLRAQLALVHAPIAGDDLYGSVRAPRLLLHAQSLQLVGLAPAVQSEVPSLFEGWIEGRAEGLGDARELERKLADAASRRFPLVQRTQALRWVNSAADALPGLEIDWYDGYVTLSPSTEEATERVPEIASLLLQAGARGVYLKQRARADLRRLDASELAPPVPIVGEAAPESFDVREESWRIAVQLADGLSTGLFLDQRENREFLRQRVAGQEVLNLFAYTGSFSVAAALGGARRVTTVDLSKRAVERARRNFELNGLPLESHRFFAEDAVRFLDRAARRGDTYDWVVLDPPSFASNKSGKVLSVARDYAELVARCVRVLGPGGNLLAVTNHRGTRPEALRSMLADVARREGRTIEKLKSLASALDFPPT